VTDVSFIFNLLKWGWRLKDKITTTRLYALILRAFILIIFQNSVTRVYFKHVSIYIGTNYWTSCSELILIIWYSFRIINFSCAVIHVCFTIIILKARLKISEVCITKCYRTLRGLDQRNKCTLNVLKDTIRQTAEEVCHASSFISWFPTFTLLNILKTKYISIPEHPTTLTILLMQCTTFLAAKWALIPRIMLGCMIYIIGLWCVTKGLIVLYCFGLCCIGLSPMPSCYFFPYCMTLASF